MSPPTALSPFAAAAITGADPMRTTLQSWKYTLPAFVVPLAFVVEPAGTGLLLAGDPVTIALTSLTALLGIVALAAGAQGRAMTETTLVERAALIIGGLALVYPAPQADAAGAGLVIAALAAHGLRQRRVALPTPTT